MSEPQHNIVTKSTEPSSATASASPPSQPSLQTKRRRRKCTPPYDSDLERVTGYVLASGKYKCSDPHCADLRFGRQADFKRHHTNSHADQILEFFCPVAGCDRSIEPSKRSRGRSFKGRKDKMEEHVQAVHHKRVNKRVRTATDEEGTSSEGGGAERSPLSKTQKYA